MTPSDTCHDKALEYDRYIGKMLSRSKHQRAWQQYQQHLQQQQQQHQIPHMGQRRMETFPGMDNRQLFHPDSTPGVANILSS